MSCSQSYPSRGITRISSIAAPQAGQSGEAGRRRDCVRSSRIMALRIRSGGCAPVTFVTGKTNSRMGRRVPGPVHVRALCRPGWIVLDEIARAAWIGRCRRGGNRCASSWLCCCWNDSRLPVAGPGPNGERRDPGNDTSRRSSGCGADRRQDDPGEDQLAACMPGRTGPLRLCRYRHQRLLHEGAALRLRARRPLSLRRPTPERCGSPDRAA
jgi:hypothetical protein